MSNNKFQAHPKAIVEAIDIGEGTRIWAFCNIQKSAKIGANCNICDHCFVENNVIIGNNVTVKNGVSLWDGMVIEDKVFIGPNAVFTNDIYPRSQVYHDQFDKTLIKTGATIGANATVVAGHTIGRFAFIGAGSVVTTTIPDYTIWYGNPARQRGFICRCAKKLSFKYSDDKKTNGNALCSCGLEYNLTNNLVTCKRAE